MFPGAGNTPLRTQGLQPSGLPEALSSQRQESSTAALEVMGGRKRSPAPRPRALWEKTLTWKTWLAKEEGLSRSQVPLSWAGRSRSPPWAGPAPIPASHPRAVARPLPQETLNPYS